MKKIECYDISHRSDVFRECGDIPTLCARMGTGGNNVPIVLMNQCGGVMTVEHEKVEKHGHKPTVLSENGTDRAISVDKTPPLKTTTIPTLFYGCVRRLTPVECERLMGFKDNYTQIPYRGKSVEQCPDSPRYKAIGNSWAVPVVRWIGARIDKALKES